MLEKLKFLLLRRSGNAAKQRVPIEPIEHAVLGSLVPAKAFPDCLVGRISCGESFVELSVNPDGQPIGTAIGVATRATESLSRLDALCKSLIADDALEGYNNDWRFGQTTLEDGTFSAFERPLLARDEFCRKLVLESVEAHGTLMLILSYSDSDDMFWGHGFQVTFFDGLAFEDAHVSMVG